MHLILLHPASLFYWVHSIIFLSSCTSKSTQKDLIKSRADSIDKQIGTGNFNSDVCHLNSYAEHT